MPQCIKWSYDKKMYLSKLVILVVVYSLPCDLSSAPTTDTPVDGVSCKSQSDCPLNQCCVHNPLNKPDSRKRFLFDHYNEHDHGFCRSARNLNQSCWPIGRDPANGELYEFFCPCTSGLECRGLIVHESAHQIVHERPMCQSPESNLIDSVTYSGQVCSADGDCSGGMCCVFHPDNRRQQSTGYCRNFKQLNDTCTIVDVGGPLHDFGCPCGKGLECRGLSIHHSTVNGHGHIETHINPVCQTPVTTTASPEG